MFLPKGYGEAVTAMLIWGSVGVFVRIAAQPAATIVFVRVFTAFLVLALFALLRKQPFSFAGHGPLAVLSGIFIAANWLFFFKSIQTTTIGNAVLTYYMAPVLAILWARLFLKERLERRFFQAIPLAGAGVVLMTSEYSFSLSSNDFIGILFGLAGAFFYSFVVVMAKYMSGITPRNLVMVQMGVSSLFFLPFVLFDPPTLTLPSTSAMITMGVVHSALALSIYFSSLQKIKIQHASILSYIDPASALLYAYLIFQETPGLYTLLGGACILLASWLVIRR